MRILSKLLLLVQFALLAWFSFFGLLFSYGFLTGNHAHYINRVAGALTTYAIVSLWLLLQWVMVDGPARELGKGQLRCCGVAAGIVVTIMAKACDTLTCPSALRVDNLFTMGVFFLPTSLHPALEIWWQRRALGPPPMATQAHDELHASTQTPADAPAVTPLRRPLWLGLLASTLTAPLLAASAVTAFSFSMLPYPAFLVLAIGVLLCGIATLLIILPLLVWLRQRGNLGAAALCALAALSGALLTPSLFGPALQELGARLLRRHLLEVAGTFMDLNDLIAGTTATQWMLGGALVALLSAGALCVAVGLPFFAHRARTATRVALTTGGAQHARPLRVGALAAGAALLAWCALQPLLASGVMTTAVWGKSTCIAAAVSLLAAALWARRLRQVGALRAQPIHTVSAVAGTFASAAYAWFMLGFMANQYGTTATLFMEMSSTPAYRFVLVASGGLAGLAIAAVFCAAAGITQTRQRYADQD